MSFSWLDPSSLTRPDPQGHQNNPVIPIQQLVGKREINTHGFNLRYIDAGEGYYTLQSDEAHPRDLKMLKKSYSPHGDTVFTKTNQRFIQNNQPHLQTGSGPISKKARLQFGKNPQGQSMVTILRS